MAPPVNENQVEAIARYMCVGDGNNPDEWVPRFDDPDKHVACGDLWGGERHEQWREYTTIARRYLAANEAMKEIAIRIALQG